MNCHMKKHSGKGMIGQREQERLGILIEMPKLSRSQFLDHKLAFEMLEYALSEIKL